jgi:hypothetical protein
MASLMTIEPILPPPDPTRPVTERERDVAVELIQRAVAADLIRFEELDDRFEALYAATNRGELDAVTADLPAPPPPSAPVPAHPIAPVSYSIFGNVNAGGWIAVGGDLTYGSGFGDVTLDLSSARLHRDLTVRVRSIFGDVTVILPDGVRAHLQSVTVFGDRKERLSPPVAGAPHVRVVAASLFGDAKLYSLSLVPEGPFRRMWRKLRGN